MPTDLMAQHVFRTGPHGGAASTPDELGTPKELRKQIEPWLTAIFQTEHLSVLLGSGFSVGVSAAAGVGAATMASRKLECPQAAEIDAYATQTAGRMGRGGANIEDQIRAAIQLRDGLVVAGDKAAEDVNSALNAVLIEFLKSMIAGERSLRTAGVGARQSAEDLLVTFLMSFASRAATRERLNILTTNYDRIVEYGCDLAGLHVIDRFVGALAPVFRSSRLDIDIHYNPPGIRGEPRYLEGVVRLNKLHGSLDWRWEDGVLRRVALPFGAAENHPGVPATTADSVMIYPNPAKDVETLEFPYAELFRDLAAAVCRPNSSLVTYGYGFGDDHINRIIRDMLTIPSTHLVIIGWDTPKPDEEDDPANAPRQRIIDFCRKTGRDAQISLLLGSHFGDLGTLVRSYLPKPAIDLITIRRARIIEERGDSAGGNDTSAAETRGETGG